MKNKLSAKLVGPDPQSYPLSKLPKTFPTKIDENLTLGIDLGIGSCGLALIHSNKNDQVKPIHGFESFCKDEELKKSNLLFLGVRTFDVPEEKTPSGIKLKNPERREKRLIRRRILRKAKRLKHMRRWLMNKNLLPEDYLENFNTNYQKEHIKANPWQWRIDGLTRQLTNWELACVLLYFTKHRGFKSNKKSELNSKGSKGGTLESIKENNNKMEELGVKTIPQLFLADPRFKLGDKPDDHPNLFLPELCIRANKVLIWVNNSGHCAK
jgi:CRISPR/Cas system Type II protein with McrA/HNH and RuvC-like nuclease domain